MKLAPVVGTARCHYSIFFPAKEAQYIVIRKKLVFDTTLPLEFDALAGGNEPGTIVFRRPRLPITSYVLQMAEQVYPAASTRGIRRDDAVSAAPLPDCQVDCGYAAKAKAVASRFHRPEPASSEGITLLLSTPRFNSWDAANSTYDKLDLRGSKERMKAPSRKHPFSLLQFGICVDAAVLASVSSRGGGEAPGKYSKCSGRARTRQFV